MPETVIGCSHNSSGFQKTGSGIVGLSWDRSSLISQMGKNMHGAFSYCLSPGGTSKINFGSNAIVSGNGTVSTPMFLKKAKPGFYYLNLDAVSVGETRVETLGTPFHAVDGNMINYLVLDKHNTYMAYGHAICLVILCNAEEALFGNRAQNNFLVGYDHSSRLVSFKPTDCEVAQDIPRDSISAALVLQ
ncbi:unnamed protein product, partial [Brassica oleracea var. botrytis]